METTAHLQLKRLALGFLRSVGCQAVATEVHCPISRYRIDVAGYQDRFEESGVSGGPPAGEPPEPRTFIIECKQSREDFFRDCEHAEPLLAMRERYERIRRSIEEHSIKRFEPQLRHAGSTLFAELDDWDFSTSRSQGYRKVLRRLKRIDQKLHGETKFFLLSRYRLADQLFIAAPVGMIRPREVPIGWGLIEFKANLTQAATVDEINEFELRFDIKVSAPVHHAKPARRLRLLRNIAVAASRDLGR